MSAQAFATARILRRSLAESRCQVRMQNASRSSGRGWPLACSIRMRCVATREWPSRRLSRASSSRLPAAVCVCRGQGSCWSSSSGTGRAHASRDRTDPGTKLPVAADSRTQGGGTTQRVAIGRVSVRADSMSFTVNRPGTTWPVAERVRPPCGRPIGKLRHRAPPRPQSPGLPRCAVRL